MTFVLPRRSAGRGFAPALIVAVALTMTSLAGVGLLALGATTAAQEENKDKEKEKAKPKLSLRANPVVAFAPARIHLVGELKGGANDFEDFYCASVEWEWGDGTTSEFGDDCEPYEAGKSEIRRLFPIEHIYKYAGTYVVGFRLKHKDKVLDVAHTTVQLRPGAYGGH